MSGNQDPRPNRKLRSLLVDPKMLGASLKPVSAEVINSDGNDLEGLWLHSDRDLDFFVWRDENKTIIKQQLCFMGIVAEWNIIEGARTGVLSEDERKGGVTGSSLVEYDPQVQKMVLDQASQICSNIASLSVDEREDCAKVWRHQSGSGIHTTFTRFIESTYGSAKTKSKITSKTSGFAALTNWFKTLLRRRG